MIALSPPRGSRDCDIDVQNTGEFPGVGAEDTDHQFIDFGDGNLLDCIDFDDLFIDIKGDGVGGLLPDLEIVDISEFSSSPVSGAEETSDVNTSEAVDGAGNGAASANDEGDKSASEGDEPGKDSGESKGDGNSKSSSSKNNSSQGKKKAKVDWTPELHRKFVQAVEQLGLDKAVPSKILEIMGMKCLTRHNIASHLQKYRSHRKHLLAREAEAATWSHQRRMAYGVGKTDPSPWVINGGPIMGFPPPVVPQAMQSPFRPLHVWGHPSFDHSVWPKHHVHQLPQALPPRPAWPAAVGPPYSPIPPPAPSLAPGAYWHPFHHQVSSTVTPGTPCFPQPRAFTGLMSAPHVPGIPPIEDPGIRVPAGQSGPQPMPDLYPSGESIDAAIGDALTKPWQPLPLGLKPPSLDGVLTELQRQGIPSVPPSSPS